MKTLLLLRHAKSSWKHTELAEHDRPLKRRGEKAAKRVGELIRELDLIPELIVTSDAVRALETAQRVAKRAKFDGELQVCRELYHAEPAQLARFVSKTPNQIERLLVVGHNPGLSDWLKELTGVEEELPTAALARVDLRLSSWRRLTLLTRGTLVGLWRPVAPEA